LFAVGKIVANYFAFRTLLHNCHIVLGSFCYVMTWCMRACDLWQQIMTYGKSIVHCRLTSAQAASLTTTIYANNSER